MSIIDRLMGREVVSKYSEEDYLGIQRDTERLLAENVKLNTMVTSLTGKLQEVAQEAWGKVKEESARADAAEARVERLVAVRCEVITARADAAEAAYVREHQAWLMVEESLQAIRARIERYGGLELALAVLPRDETERRETVRRLRSQGWSIRKLQQAIFGNQGGCSFYRVKRLL